MASKAKGPGVRSCGAWVDVVQSKNASTPALPEAGILDSFVAPLTSSTFLQTCFRRKCVAFLGGKQERVASLIERLKDLDVEQLCEETASDTISCWLRLPEGKIDTVRVQDSASALTLHNAGASLYLRSSQDVADDFIGALARDLGLGPAGFFDARLTEPQGEIEIFVTRKGHVTDWHFDFQENFTFQLSGSKRWRVKHSGITSPVRGATPHYATQADVVEQQLKVNRLADSGKDFKYKPEPSFFDDAEEVVLGPGDLFYFPAGMWHSVECVEDGVSVNLSMVGTTWADTATHAVRQTLWRDAAWREMASLRADMIGQAGQAPSGSEAAGRSATAGAGASASASASAKTAATSSNGAVSTHQGVSSLYLSLFPLACNAVERPDGDAHADTAMAGAASKGKQKGQSGQASTAAVPSADLPAAYSRLGGMCQQALEQLQLTLRPDVLVPPAAFLLNRLRPVKDDEEDEEEAEDDSDNDDEEEEEGSDDEPAASGKRASAAGRGRGQPPASKRARHAKDESSDDEPGSSDGDDDEDEDGQEDGDGADQLAGAAGPGIVLGLSNGTLVLDLTSAGNDSAADGSGTQLPAHTVLAWSPLASCSTHQELTAAGVQLADGDEDEDEEDGDDEISEDEDEGHRHKAKKGRGGSIPSEPVTVVVHVGFGGPELADTLRCLLVVTPAQSHALQRMWQGRMSASAGGAASSSSPSLNSFSLSDVATAIADAEPGAHGSKPVAKKSKGAQAGAGGSTATAARQAEALSRALLFVGGAVLL